MNTYLIIITTVLVLTQVIRLIQNTISLFRQQKKIDEAVGWIRKNDVSENDFEVQRAVFYMMLKYLQDKGYKFYSGDRADIKVRSDKQ